MDDLAETFMADSHNFGRAIGAHGRIKKIIDGQMANYRVLMMKARKFKLDDDFTDLSMRASHIMPEEALARVQGTILPYDVVWMEYNPRVKVAASISMSDNPAGKVGDMVRDKAGLLMVRDAVNHNAFSVQQISRAEIKKRHGGVIELETPHPMAMIFDANGKEDIEKATIGGLKGWSITTDIMADVMKLDGIEPKDISACLWGYVKKSEKGGMEPRGLARLLPKGLSGHAAVAYSSVFESFMRMAETDIEGKSAILDQFAHDMKENSGIMRWISTVLCMLSEVPMTVSEPRRDASVFMRSSLGGSKPGFERHYVTLNLPRVKNRVRYVARKIAGGGRKKRHEVQTHWRTYLSDTAHGCIHQWMYSDELDHRKCTVCESFSTKVKSHLRGDESLGWSTRTVRITAKKED